ncbi:RluA family pseudouridine synthase [Leptospira sp. 96542]|nr:RluA family pseudouridine synthase [Leptospira sp. 96542]
MTKTPPSHRYLPKGLSILYEDNEILVVNKPAGLLTIATNREKTKTAYAALTDYVKKGNLKSRNRVFIVHRLDKDTSGILLFAKSEKTKLNLQSNWQNFQKIYFAVCEGGIKQKSGVLSNYLAESKVGRVYVTENQNEGKLSITEYEVLKETKSYSLLKIILKTGRKHQIRVQFAHNHHSIVGDKKYGNTQNKLPRMALHAYSIQFLHPITNKSMLFEAEIPNFITSLVGGYEKFQTPENKQDSI